eukprot:6210671-Pleurochrysis_carterae.AAC.1
MREFLPSPERTALRSDPNCRVPLWSLLHSCGRSAQSSCVVASLNFQLVTDVRAKHFSRFRRRSVLAMHLPPNMPLVERECSCLSTRLKQGYPAPNSHA